MLSLPSFTFVPGWLYLPLFNGIIFLLVMTAVVHGFKGDIYRWNASRSTRFIGALLVVFLILYIGLRPTTSYGEYSYFCDTFNYKSTILALKALNPPSWLSTQPYLQNEWLYACIESFSAFYADEHLAFLIAAVFYVGCAALFCKRMFGVQWFLPFLMICSAFTFFSYGVNGVRNGMAASMVILALSYRDKLWVAALLCFLAVGVHKSMYLLIASALLAWKVTNPKLYIAGWLVCIAAAAAGGGGISSAIASSGFFDDPRLVSYAGTAGANSPLSGFRADFLLYSALPIITGWYFFIRRGYRDKTYLWLFNIYVTSNAFWILMMYASFSNRFAQLSWFIMPIVLMYPWFKVRVWKDQSQHLAGFILICYAYTFYGSCVSIFT